MGGVQLSAHYSRYQISAEVQGDLFGWVLTFPIPKGLQRNSLRVYVNGILTDCSLQAPGNSLEITIDHKQASTEIIIK